MGRRWKVRRAKYPADPDRPWMVIPPSGSIMAAHRFATFEQARKFVASKAKLRTRKEKS